MRRENPRANRTVFQRKSGVLGARTAVLGPRNGQKQGLAVTEKSLGNNYKQLIVRELQSEQGSKDGLHISEPDAVRDFAGLLAHVRLGAEIVIVNGAYPPTILRTAAPPRRSIEECIALLPADSTATIDDDFPRDVAAAVAAHREPLNPSAWD